MIKKLSKKEQELLTLVNKGGDDAGLLLLDRIHELEDLMAMHAEMMEKKMDGLKTELESKIPNLETVAEKIRGKDADNEAILAGLVNIAREEIAKIKPKDGKTPTIQELKVLIKPLIPTVKDGHTPTKDELLRLIEPLIPPPLPVKDGKPADEEKIVEKIEKDIPKLGEPIRDALELLKGDDRLDESAIRNLKEKLEKIERVANSKKVIGGGSLSANMVQYVDLSSQLNGSTKTFYLEGDHQGIVAALGSSAPYVFRPTVDYTESGPNIVFDAAVDATISLAAGQSLIVLVKRKSI